MRVSVGGARPGRRRARSGGSALAVDRDLSRRRHPTRDIAPPSESRRGGSGADLAGSSPLGRTPRTRSQSHPQPAGRRVARYTTPSPHVSRDSIDDSSVCQASRYGKETMEGAGARAVPQLPVPREEYRAFLDALSPPISPRPRVRRARNSRACAVESASADARAALRSNDRLAGGSTERTASYEVVQLRMRIAGQE